MALLNNVNLALHEIWLHKRTSTFWLVLVHKSLISDMTRKGKIFVDIDA